MLALGEFCRHEEVQLKRKEGGGRERQRLSESKREDERGFSSIPPIDPGAGLIAVTCCDSSAPEGLEVKV